MRNANLPHPQAVLASPPSDSSLLHYRMELRNYTIVYASPALRGALGYDVVPNEDVLSNWLSIVHPDDRERLVRGLYRSRETAGRWNDEQFRLRHRDGEYRWYRGVAWLEPLTGEPTHATGYLVDITEHDHAEEALKDREERLRHAQRMEAMGHLASGVAHDFNNLLTIITGYGDLLQSRVADDEKASRYVRGVLDATSQARRLIAQLLAFSRNEVIEPQVLDLNHVVEDMERMLRRLLPEYVKVETSLDYALGAVRAAPGQIGQVLMNLAVNARDAMPGGGRLHIETRGVMLDEAEAHALGAGTMAGTYAVLTVGDTGTGMDEATRARIFEPFYTTKEKGKGTGLGLSNVFAIVQQIGGRIRVESTPGVGSRFEVFLPQVQETPGDVAAEPTADAVPGTETVLVVEDREEVRDLIREILEMAGYTVHVARDGEDALALCHDSAPDLLITDLVMPRMSGHDLACQLAKQHTGLRVLFVSGHTNQTAAAAGLATDVAPILHKPFNPRELVHCVREILDAEQSAP